MSCAEAARWLSLLKSCLHLRGRSVFIPVARSHYSKMPTTHCSLPRFLLALSCFGHERPAVQELFRSYLLFVHSSMACDTMLSVLQFNVWFPTVLSIGAACDLKGCGGCRLHVYRSVLAAMSDSKAIGGNGPVSAPQPCIPCKSLSRGCNNSVVVTANLFFQWEFPGETRKA